MKPICLWAGAALWVAAAGLPGMASAALWIVDERSGCGTSNNFARPNESIRWYGACIDGKLDGHGVLIWFNGLTEIERNEGGFRNGEFDGIVITTYPDGKSIIGRYNTGIRDGRFVIIQSNGVHTELIFRAGTEQSRRVFNVAEVQKWRTELTENWVEVILAFLYPLGVQTVPVTAPRSPPPTTTPESAAATFAAEPRPYPVDTGAADTPIAKARLYVEDGELRVKQYYPPATNVTGLWPVKPNETRQSADAYFYRTQDSVLVKVYENGAPADTAVVMRDAAVRKPVYRPVPQQNPPPAAAPRQERKSAPMPAASATQAADALFKQAFLYESAGQFYDAEQAYSQILLRYPSAPTALLANARLNYLTDRARSSSVRIEPEAPSRVVAVNAPRPRREERAEGGYGISAPRLAYNSPAMNRSMCSRKGLYEDGAQWCGVVVEDQRRFYRIKVADVKLPSFGLIGLDRSTCTGNTFLNWFSRGATVKVPKQCMAFSQ